MEYGDVKQRAHGHTERKRGPNGNVATTQAQQERDRRISLAQAQYNKIIPRAMGQASQALLQAEGYAVERVNRANGEATRFRAILAEYQRAPEVTRRRIYLEAMGSILPEAKALYIVDSDQKALLPWLRLESGQMPAVAGAQSGQAPSIKGGK